jgi:hypothetical protein
MSFDAAGTSVRLRASRGTGVCNIGLSNRVYVFQELCI